jgi:hypothetical protein
MKASDLHEYMTKMGRRGGLARVKATTAAQRRAIAAKAGKASGEARRLSAALSSKKKQK